MTTSSRPAQSGPKSHVDLGEIVAVVAVVEVVSGFAVLAKPAFVVQLLLGPDAEDGGIAQCFGIALVALAIACWPIARRPSTAAVRGLGVFAVMFALYLVGVRTIMGQSGVLLWPVVLVHALFALLLIWKSSVQ